MTATKTANVNGPGMPWAVLEVVVVGVVVVVVEVVIAVVVVVVAAPELTS